MILKPLVKIRSRFSILKIGDKEIPFETRLEYIREDDERPGREHVITSDGREFPHETEFLQEFGVRAPWNRETGMVDGREVQFFRAGPPDAMLILVNECTLNFCDYWLRDLVQEKRERENPDGRHFTKVPLEYLTNVVDLPEKERDMIYRCLERQLKGEKNEIADPPPPPEPTPEELSNIDELPPPELQTLIGKLDAQQQWDKLKQTARQKASWFSKLKQANQTQRCTHIKPDGSPCGSPAVKEKTLCYWHEQARLHRPPAEDLLLDGADVKRLHSVGESASNGASHVGSTGIEMPVLEDRLGIQLGIMRVCDLLAARSIDPYTAQVMLCGLRLAQRTLADQNLLEQQQ